MQVLYPLEVPDQIRNLIEAAILAHNNHNYSHSLENYENARDQWSILIGSDNTIGVQLYFEFAQGQVKKKYFFQLLLLLL